MKGKKAQIDNPILIFAVIVIALLFMAPIVLKIMRSVQAPTSAALGNITNGGSVAQSNFNTVINTGINMWDKVVIFAFIVACMLLLVSAFLVDASPFWIILYIMLNFMLILFAPNIIQAVDNIYNSASFAQEVALLSFMDALRTYYAEFLVGMMVLSGIIIYGKIFLLGGSNNRR